MLAKTLQPLAEARAWFVAPAGPLTLPLRGDLGLLDFWLHDPVAKAVERGFWQGGVGEVLWVAATGSPFAGILMLGTGSARDWIEACELALKSLPAAGPAAATVAVLRPTGVAPPKRPWHEAADRFIPVVKARWPQVRHWVWLDLDERN